MKTALDCVPCILRQSLEAARMVSTDPVMHEQTLRSILQWAREMDLDQSPPALAQRLHRYLRGMTGVDDPYRRAKDQLNQLALELVPPFRAKVEADDDPLKLAARLAIAGNIMDMGVIGNLTEAEVRETMDQALHAPFFGELENFRQAVAEAKSILYLADNAGEIVFDRLLIEQLPRERVTLVVRGAPIINDVTLIDAQTVGLDQLVEVIENGSDAPGTILSDCSPEFRRHFSEADLIISKGQGNFETLSGEAGNIFFLFKVKCPMVAKLVGQPVGMQMLVQSSAAWIEVAKNEIGAHA
jgi:uncharacterized protein with ATP-grasp and redox domains